MDVKTECKNCVTLYAFLRYICIIAGGMQSVAQRLITVQEIVEQLVLLTFGMVGCTIALVEYLLDF